MFRPLFSGILVRSQRRLTGLRYLNPYLDFGNGLSVENFAVQTEAMQAKLAAHNALVAELNAKIAASRAEVKTMERSLSKLAERVLNTIAAVHGKDSDEYEMVGGTKRVPKTTSNSALNPTNPGETQPMLLTSPSIEPLSENAIEHNTLNATQTSKKTSNGNGKLVTAK